MAEIKRASVLADLQRPSGALAMLAIDQRESMRAMFAEHQNAPVTDDQIVEFKMRALKTLTPFASAVLIDREFGWAQAIVRKAVAPGCGLIAAADRFHAKGDELVADVEIDDLVDPARVRSEGAKALKLLVVWRPDEAPEKRIAMVQDFVGRCRRAGLLSIIEPVSRRSRDGSDCDLQEGILSAARELGCCEQDLYKAEIPLQGRGNEGEVRRRCADLSRMIRSPWVVLSSGVDADHFPTAVGWACKEGASGFLAGRAVWRNTIGSADVDHSLTTDAVDRLKLLCETVDRAVDY